jgi:hypothetical protein
MKRLVAILLVSSTVQANADFLTFRGWAQFEPTLRTMYLMGAWDTYESFVSATHPNAVHHFRNCVAKFKFYELASNVLEHGKSRPQFQTQPPAVAMIDYLTATCGAAPN